MRQDLIVIGLCGIDVHAAPPFVCAASKCRLPIQMRLNSNQKPEFAGGIKGERCVGTRADDRLESIANGKGGVESDPAEVESE